MAAVLSGFGISFASSNAPVLKPTLRSDLPPTPWSKSWSNVPALSVQTSAPNLHQPRPITVRTLFDRATFYLLVEWRTDVPDLGFDGAYYPSWVNSERAMVQESTLLRDEIVVWFGPAGSNGSQNEALRAERSHGHWVWKSQWQDDVDSSVVGKVRKELGTPYVMYYPIEGDGALVARSVGNTNAITDADSACKWIMNPAKDVYTLPGIGVLDGEGRWKDGRWRVLFRAPVSSMLKLGTTLQLTVGIANGSLGERSGQRAISQPLLLDLSSLEEGKER